MLDLTFDQEKSVLFTLVQDNSYLEEALQEDLCLIHPLIRGYYLYNKDIKVIPDCVLNEDLYMELVLSNVIEGEAKKEYLRYLERINHENKTH